MKRDFEQALAELLPATKGLRAVIVSAAPDGLIAWCWSRDDKPDIALGFAALERAAARCIDELGASQQGRSMLLTAQNVWVASWPLGESRSDERSHLVVTTVFEGQLQNGMIMLYGQRIRQRLSELLRDRELAALRRSLAAHMHAAEDPLAALRELAAATGLDPLGMDQLSALSPASRARLQSAIAGAS